jgi:hypothetical protein
MQYLTSDNVRDIRYRISTEISTFYPKDRQFIARECLALGYMWANSQVPTGVRKTKAVLRKECEAYINANLNLDPKGFAIPSFLLYWIISALVKWVAQIIIDFIFEVY